MAARLTRAKARLARAGPALDLPDDATVDARLPAVRRAVHLTFTLGHTAAGGTDLVDDELADRAQYLAGVLRALRPDDPEFTGLLSLILLTRARGPGRIADDGSQVLLEDADRSRWDRSLIDRGVALLRIALATAERQGTDPGPMTLQAAISAEHSTAPRFAATDWPRLLALYDALLTADPSPTLAIGRSIVLSYLIGPGAGLADLDEVVAVGGLDRYPYAHAARAQMLARLGRSAEADGAWRAAAVRARSDAERTFFADRADRR
jgi:RNA polymerase sigma-70 factor (ECF subfamily)